MSTDEINALGAVMNTVYRQETKQPPKEWGDLPAAERSLWRLMARTALRFREAQARAGLLLAGGLSSICTWSGESAALML